MPVVLLLRTLEAMAALVKPPMTVQQQRQAAQEVQPSLANHPSQLKAAPQRPLARVLITSALPQLAAVA